MSDLTEARVRELAREEIRAAAQPPAPVRVGDFLRNEHGDIVGKAMPADAPAPVQPVATRELTPAEVEECAIAARAVLALSSHDVKPNKATMDEVRNVLSGGESIDPEWDRAVLAKAAEIRTRPPAVPQPAPSLSPPSEEQRATARRIVARPQPSEAEIIAGGVAFVTGEGVPQPAPSATVDEVMTLLLGGRIAAVPDRLRAALSTLSPAQLRGMVDAINNERK